ncbi:S8 family serine peptidase [Paraliobacillus salinarum]|uniref:S8 family serine peptidase n=1 Tax=Paraliobacillus salinarum TaxID=1158996 RepID=UPI0015F5E588|nr:S8 family serine peptidase [Paraliobacillus salinarum]
MRFLILLCSIFLIIMTSPILTYAKPAIEQTKLIIEVDGDPHQHKQYIETYHPTVKVVEVFHTLFQGLAIQAKEHQLRQLVKESFVKNSYPVKTYQTQINQSVPFLLKNETNQSVVTYTGEGVKIGVIDTGIDYNHPDLQGNYQGGFDLVDLDDDPMETMISQGMPTIHGTHVAGIIGANGKMKGIAPNVSLYGYRALGPGGSGTSIQVIAALEKAVNDGMDIINMSLGNAVNGPDWPTSVAVNRAVEKGVSVVIANGNSGPANWTVGSPATATKAIAVGASTPLLQTATIIDRFENKQIDLIPISGSQDWTLQRKYPLVDGDTGAENSPSLSGKIALIKRGKLTFTEKVKQAEAAGAVGVIIYNNEKGPFQAAIQEKSKIPAVTISKKDGEWLKKQLKQSSYWIETEYHQQQDQMTDFSSRGPVTANWSIKPEIVAPGANITSTIPGSQYQTLQGTSMAAPHIAGALALLKEAHPNWTPAQLKGALLTQAKPLQKEGILYDPIEQGMGRVQLDQSIETKTILHDALLSFGKVDDGKKRMTTNIEIENVSNQTNQFSFAIPKQQAGLRWLLPQTISIGPGEKRSIPIKLTIDSNRLATGIHQGWIQLFNRKERYQIPYIFINQTADYPKAMGLELNIDPFNSKEYTYQLYLPEAVAEVKIDLYDPDTLMFVQTFIEEKDQSNGVLEGIIEKKHLPSSGDYIAAMTVLSKENKSYYEETVIHIR